MDPLTYLQTEPTSWTLMQDTLMSVVIVKNGSHKSSICVSLKVSSMRALNPKPDIMLV